MAVESSPFSLSDFLIHKKFMLKKENLMLNKIIKNQKKYTVRYSLSNPALFLSSPERLFYKNIFAVRPRVKKPLKLSTHYGKSIYDFLYKSDSKFDVKSIRRLFRDFSYKSKSSVFRANLLWSLFDIHFIRKEKLYTKLKYSRVPQYDMVSGGVAALFAAFLGFLITEKFGFELLDSGDFYYFFMYFVFIGFFARTLLRLVNNHSDDWSIISYRWFIQYYKTLVLLFIKFCKNLISSQIFK
jgi:hypothetical protein